MDNYSEFLALRKKYIEKRFSALNPQQRKAALSSSGAALVLAGAGSGKTTVIVNRILCLLEFGCAYDSDEICYAPTAEDVEVLQVCLDGYAQPDERLRDMLHAGSVKPWNILAITFTNKAASQLKERITRAVGPAGQDVFASTFHSACVRFLRRDAQLLGWPQSFTIYDSDDSERVVKDIYKSMGIDDKMYPVRWMTSRFGLIKDGMLTVEEFVKSAPHDPRTETVAKVYTEYQRRLKEAGAFDFDDLIYFTVRLLQENPDVRDYYHRRFRYVMVDEYQDTSRAQYMLVKLLTNEENNIFVVGDDDQSIYSFRGATIENILNFEQDFAPAKVIRLEQNYRSTANILGSANSVIRNNRGRKGKELWTDSGDGEKVHVHLAENEQDEAVYISREIYKHTEAGIPLSAHAVLYRTNAQSSTVETYFARAGVPYKVVGALRFYDRAEIKDVMSYLSIIANPADNLRLKRIINKPARKIGDTTIERIDRIAAERGVPMLAILRDCEQYADLSRAAAPLRSFYSLYERLLECYHSEALGDFVDKLLDLTGYRAMLVAMGKEAESKLENINEFVSTVRLYEQQNPEGDLAAFLEEIALVSNLDNFDEAADRVSLMTIHSAKGLEFDYVYLIGMEDGIFPLDRARHSEADMEEERRLAYVGMTRAKKELHMTRAQMRMLYGMTRRNPPSRFLQEIDGEYTVETGEQQKPRSYLQGDYSRAQSAAAAGSFGRPYSGSSYGGGYGASASAKDSASYGSKPAAAAPKPRVKPNEITFHEGDSVQHRMFGKGRVISATPIGGDVLLEIEFETCGRKKAMANYAPMTKLED
ncbi:MAG: UvrD-helicase domain-containing protein [Oscillospiraceae bacterium]|nr:UvrD-helicase domain-containing protein [Oscillospiraceae bacterium]